LVVLIVRQQLRRAADVLAVTRVLDQALDLHRDRLLHLAAHDAAGKGPELRRLRLALLDRTLLFSAHLRFPPAAASSASRTTVFNRAMFRRTLRNWSGFTAWPVARCMRSANCSLRSFNSSSASSSGFLARSSLASISAPAVLRTSWTRKASSRPGETPDRKSTRLNSSHVKISYA